jgi:nitrogen fixation NifU-like protein
MSDLRELYQQVILDHNKSPRNFRRLEDANRASEGYNPLCGDHLHLYLKVAGGVIQDIGFQGAGCAISKASASLMSSMLKGKTKEEAEGLFKRFHDMVTGAVDAPPDTEGLGKLAVFAGVREFPARVKCATLAWHTLHAALKGEDKPVSTE